jgi:alkylated DNA repair dioxygenase AlkB
VKPQSDRVSALQLDLLDSDPEPSIDASFAGMTRDELGNGAWIDVLPGWVRGSDRLFNELLEGVDWKEHEIKIYDRVIRQPRLSTRVEMTELPRWPVLVEMVGALEARYGEQLVSCWMNLYRDGRDGVAWHGDREGRRQDTALVADVSFGHRRRFLVRPKGRGRSRRYDIGRGDLLVMGGTCQRTFDHSVPKVARAGPRISITFRPWNLY